MAFVSEVGAVRVVGLDILHVMEVVHARLGQVERVDEPAQPADSVQFVSVVMGALRGAISVGGGASFLLIVQRLARVGRQTSTGLESM